MGRPNVLRKHCGKLTWLEAVIQKCLYDNIVGIDLKVCHQMFAGAGNMWNFFPDFLWKSERQVQDGKTIFAKLENFEARDLKA